jgi:O-methyltransferase involved in polyketide biosynthesis
MADKHQVRLGAVQETLFITLAARAAETQRKHPVLRDPKAVELLQSIDYDAAKYGRGAGGFVTVLRTAIIDFWVREFLAAHPAATVVELGTGLNARFERVDNGQMHWFDLDLPDTIELRRNFFADTDGAGWWPPPSWTRTGCPSSHGARGRTSSLPKACSSICQKSRSWPRWPGSLRGSPGP